MAKLENKDLYFIHIPKNAGTAFIHTYCQNNQVGHYPVSVFPPEIQNKSVAIIRNPYDRLVSVYEYNRMRKNYWHSFDETTKWGPPPLYDFCTTHTFDEFVQEISKLFPILHTLPDWGNHSIPQYQWLINKEGKIVVPYILYYENLQEEIKTKLGIYKRMEQINSSPRKDLREYYQNKETQDIVHKLYGKDFELFGYSKELF